MRGTVMICWLATLNNFAKTIEGSVTDIKYWLVFECNVNGIFLAKVGKLRNDMKLLFSKTAY